MKIKDTRESTKIMEIQGYHVNLINTMYYHNLFIDLNIADTLNTVVSDMK